MKYLALAVLLLASSAFAQSYSTGVPMPPMSVSGSVSIIGGVTVSGNVTITGKSPVDHIRYDYTGVSITASAYTQVTASIGGTCNEVDIFDSSGQTLVLATGAAGFESDQIYIVPSGNGRIPLKINSGSRVSLKAISADASTGEFDLNCYN